MIKYEPALANSGFERVTYREFLNGEVVLLAICLSFDSLRFLTRRTPLWFGLGPPAMARTKCASIGWGRLLQRIGGSIRRH